MVIARFYQIRAKGQTAIYARGQYSLTALKAGPADLLNLTRGHWHIENKVHWVRAVTLEEDRAQVRSGRLPHVMATLRNTALGRLRLAGETKLAAAFRRVAALPREALRLIGLNPTTE